MRISIRKSPLDVVIHQESDDGIIKRYVYLNNEIIQGFLLKLKEFGKIPVDIEPFFKTSNQKEPSP